MDDKQLWVCRDCGDMFPLDDMRNGRCSDCRMERIKGETQ